MNKQARLGTLKSNEPCNALPMQAYYSVAVEMNGEEGYPRYSRTIYWQFALSGLFAVAGMNPVAVADAILTAEKELKVTIPPDVPTGATTLELVTPGGHAEAPFTVLE